MRPTWVPEAETKPAPDPLLLLQSFINTTEADRGTDLLREMAPASAWLHEAGLLAPDAALSHDDLVRSRELREAVRSLLESNSGDGHPGDEQLDLLRSLALSAGVRLEIGADLAVRLRSEGQDPISSIAATLLLIVRDAQHDGTWERLKACSNPECRWAYYDRSHSRKGRWCDMAACGNRVKNRALRARRRR
jgi:predicted RNA-binding Zn ribbon-like protein